MMRNLLSVIIVITLKTAGVIGHNTPEAIQIIETKDGLSPNTKVLHYKGRSLMKDILTAEDVKDLPILVYSVTGKTRGGKSFLLNLMYKYLDQEGQTNWTDGLVPNVFNFKDGADSMTKGLWLGTRIFRRTLKDGTVVGIMLMDSQGLFDGEVTSGESVAMSGVSTVLSHVQMFNMKEKITTNDLEQVMLHLVPDGVEDKGSQNMTGSSLMFVVRDFLGGRKYGLGLTQGRKYIDEEQKRGTQEYQSMWADQRTVFNNIDCVLLPHPGIIVTSEEFTQSPNLKDLESNFVAEVSKYLDELFSPEKLIPHKGVFTGQKIHETLSNLDGKLADKSLSYYNIFLERSNHLSMESAVASFRNKLESSRDIYKAKEFMDMTLKTTKFKGQSANEFTSNLKKTLEGIINPKVQIHLVNLYTTATSTGDIIVSHSNIWPKVITDMCLLVGPEPVVKQTKEEIVKTLEGVINPKVQIHLVNLYTTTTSTGDIIVSHSNIWPKVITDMCLLVGPEPVVKQTKEEIVKRIATIYYTKLALKEGSAFKTAIDTATPQDFYNRMSDLKQPDTRNRFLDSSIKVCEDFRKTGVRESMLNDIRNNLRNTFGAEIDSNILRNMYKVRSYFVNGYRETVNNGNIREKNSNLWPKYENDINSLRFGSDAERRQYLQDISKEIAEIYYRLLREEVNGRLCNQWVSQNNGAFRHTYEVYNNQNNLNGLISQEFPEYEPFSRQGHFHIWKNEANVLESELKNTLHKGYYDRGLNRPPPEKKKNVFQKIEREFRRIFG